MLLCQPILIQRTAERFADILRTAFLYSTHVLVAVSIFWHSALKPFLVFWGRAVMRSPSSPYPADSRPWSQCLRGFTIESRDKQHQLLSGEEAVSLPDIGTLRPLEYQVLQKTVTSEESRRFAPQARAVLNKHAGERWSIAQNIACLYYAYCHRDQSGGSCRLPAYLVIDSSVNETGKTAVRMF